MSAGRVLIGVGVVLAAAAGVAAALWYSRETVPVVTVEAVKARDLEAVVSASGKIQPRRLVNISADTPGRVVNLAVAEGERVTRGQFLLQIDPRSLRTRVESGAASLQAAEASLEQLRQAAQSARVQLEQAQKTLTRQRDLWRTQLTTREALERAETDVRAAESMVQEREKQVSAQSARIGQERASLESARYDLSKVRIESPIEGIVTRRNIQEGETAVVGTMNNPGTVLLTLADMSVIQAEIEVDETNVPQVSLGQKAQVTIDAIPDRIFTGRVTEIGNSPVQTSSTTSGSRQATNFKVVVVIEGDIPEVRPGFSCTADITTATRASVPAVPIPAVAVRELVFDAHDRLVRTPTDNRTRRTGEAAAVPAELEPGQTRKEAEGVFVVREGRVEFSPIKTGIAGDQYFEIISGLAVGDEVVTGPYNTVRVLSNGDPVTIEAPEDR
jgi:HlyD family secretion protein